MPRLPPVTSAQRPFSSRSIAGAMIARPRLRASRACRRQTASRQSACRGNATSDRRTERPPRSGTPAAELRCRLALGESERASLGVLADGPALARMDHAPAERPDALERLRQVAHDEVRQRERITGAAPAFVDADRGRVRVGLPSGPLPTLTGAQRDAEELGPETAGALADRRREIRSARDAGPAPPTRYRHRLPATGEPPQLLGGQQPPVARLPAVAVLELDRVGRERAIRSALSGAPAPAMQVISSLPSPSARQHLRRASPRGRPTRPATRRRSRPPRRR